MNDGDCGHGWLYHESSTSPCSMCEQVERQKRNERRRIISDYKRGLKKRKSGRKHK